MCDTYHKRGLCPLKLCGIEHCPLCGIAHFAGANECPALQSETQVRLMLAALKESPEEKELVDLATAYLRGRKGTLVRRKKERRNAKLAKEHAEKMAAEIAQSGEGAGGSGFAGASGPTVAGEQAGGSGASMAFNGVYEQGESSRAPKRVKHNGKASATSTGKNGGAVQLD